ncbi:carboxypeptidase-like regulatory domain-containing protein [Tenacibaculum finnmarkense]|uniref:carboxypeptidase-like regulatory domain-containing protein n=1 Tax=Tenacibaculum finnmarkense TaxID=2781243 RepID=UPI001E380EFB|nr:carboxypeptidase-like regulatory domain-containing protein [Tenacibaculum finnmarkense]MCD8422243.1 carboxypeptidase-like regulatory domain-containing protein [Tenacibaculum finnmarkense genomovar ulcerans]MCG8239033.1 carboxypeptidase-like regulatory domain-containing protein [Tenacibaculum finnmarkense genomovar ulcerans]
MKNQFSLEINTPCSEKFNEFKSTKLGGFCNSCDKEVIDFTKMTAQEISYYFNNNTSKNTCGQFNKKQLTTYNEKPIRRKKYGFLATLGLAVLSLFSFNTTQAQEGNTPIDKNNIDLNNQEKDILVKGVVSDESWPLPGTSVFLEGTDIGTETDFDGNFTFPKLLKKGDVLIFSFVGMDTKKVIIQNNNSVNTLNLKVTMAQDSCLLMGKVAVKKVYRSKK